MTKVISILLDILLPGVGMVFLNDTWTGVTALSVWISAIEILLWAVVDYDLNPLRGVLVLASIYFCVIVFLLSAKRPKTYRVRPFFATLCILAFMFLIYLFYVDGPLSFVSVKGHGLFPGLMEGEVLLVNRIPKRSLERGDLVVARISNSTVIARIVGLPNERITVAGPSLIINDTVVPSTALGLLKVSDVPVPETEKRNIEGFEEQIGEKKYLVFFKRDVSLLPKTYEVPDGHVFLLADNRSTLFVLDSREYGAVSFSDLLGTPGHVIWSRLDRIGYIWK